MELSGCATDSDSDHDDHEVRIFSIIFPLSRTGIQNILFILGYGGRSKMYLLFNNLREHSTGASSVRPLFPLSRTPNETPTTFRQMGTRNASILRTCREDSRAIKSPDPSSREHKFVLLHWINGRKIWNQIECPIPDTVYTDDDTVRRRQLRSGGRTLESIDG